MENVLKIYVTRKDLKQPYGSPIDCPIATAIKRTYPKLGVFVGSDIVNLWDKTKYAPPLYQYSIRPEDNTKAQMRGDGKLLGKILGGFMVLLYKRYWK